MGEQNDFFQKASMYDLMANYYKYTDPSKHMHYYKKHLKYMYKALELNRGIMNKKPAVVRFLHAAHQIEKIDIYINGKRILKDVDFKDKTNYLTLPTGKYHIDIYPAGNQVSTIINKNIDLEPNNIYTLAAIGTGDKLRLIPYIDEHGVNSGISKVRFIHLSPEIPPVNVTINKGYDLFKNISYKEATNYLALSPMTIELDLKEKETGTLIKTLPNITFKPNQAYSIVMIDSTIKII